MFGIDDPGIWLAYLLAFACLIFLYGSVLPIGIKEIKRVITLNNPINEYAYPWNCRYSLHVCYRLVRVYRI